MTNDTNMDDLFEPEPIEAYCVRCRETIEMEAPHAVWTRRGVPATSGNCPYCGGKVFRMGRSTAHEASEKPESVQVATNTRVKLTQETVYINFAVEDQAFAEQLAGGLRQLGVACWLHEHDPGDISWASGVHPALTECSRMVYVLSLESKVAESVQTAKQFFKSKNKPIVIAQIAPIDPPDDIRRKPRFDFTQDYKLAFRALLEALNG